MTLRLPIQYNISKICIMLQHSDSLSHIHKCAREPTDRFFFINLKMLRMYKNIRIYMKKMKWATKRTPKNGLWNDPNLFALQNINRISQGSTIAIDLKRKKRQMVCKNQTAQISSANVKVFNYLQSNVVLGGCVCVCVYMCHFQCY